MRGSASTLTRCTTPPSSTPAMIVNSKPDHGQPTVAMEGIGASRCGPRRDADRRIVEPQHQRVALDAAGRQPVAGARSRRHADLERAVGAADDFLAGEAVALQRIGDQMSLAVVQRQRPEPRRRRDAADDDVAAAVERLLAVVGRRREGDAVAGADRQFAAARDRWRANRDRCRRCRSWAARSRRRSSACRDRCRASPSSRSRRGRRRWRVTSASKVMKISRTG